MAKGDAGDTNQRINEEDQRMNQSRQDFANQAANQRQISEQRSQGLYNDVKSGYDELKSGAHPYGMSNEEIDAIYGAGASGGGGGGGGVSGRTSAISPEAIQQMGATPYTGWQTMSQGLSPEFRSSIDQASQGWVTPEDQSRFLANGSYQNFIDTGGFSPTDVQNYRARALSPLYSTYASAQDQLNRSRALGGGNVANIGAAQAKMARDLSTTAAQTSTNAEASLAEQQRLGKQFGTSGMTAAQTALTNATEVQKQAALNAKMQTEQLDQNMKAQGLAGMTDIEKSRLQAELQAAAIQAQSSAAGASIGFARQNAIAQARQERINNELGYNLAANRGLTDLYGTRNMDLYDATNFQLQNMNEWDRGNLGLIGARVSASQMPSDYQQGLSNVGGTMSLLGSGMSMFGHGFGGNWMNFLGGGGGKDTNWNDTGVDWSNPVLTTVTGDENAQPKLNA